MTEGFPAAAGSLVALPRAAAAGADLLEVGVPFSDPLADGPTIQHASEVALAQGMTLAGVLDLVRRAALPVPVVLMTYVNPVLAYGAARLLGDAASAGVAGLLLTDVPAGADPDLERAVAASPLDLIRLVAPTPPPRPPTQAASGRGRFVYLLSRLGVARARARLRDD